jgi:dephospho-CoA kinase
MLLILNVDHLEVKGSKMKTEKLVVGLAGMPGAGKSVAVEIAKEKGYAVITMGDVVREETERRGLEPNPNNIGKVMLDLRRMEGRSAIAKRCVPKIGQTKKQKIIVDGIRSPDEVEEFKKHYRKFSLIAVQASPETRFKRLCRRRRSDDPRGWKIFHERDRRELGVGLGNAIALAEYTVLNESSREAAKKRIREILGKVEEKWMK